MPGPRHARKLLGVLAASLLLIAVPAQASFIPGGTYSSEDGTIQFTDVSCSPLGTSTVSFRATGSFPGAITWEESGTVTLGPQTGPPGHFPERFDGPVTSWSSDFEITTPGAVITGTHALADITTDSDVNRGWCSGSGSDARFQFDLLLRYSATRGSDTETGWSPNTELGDTRPGFPFQWFQTNYDEDGECYDDVDNDDDGLTDHPADPDCESVFDDTEAAEEFDDPEIDLRTPADDAQYDRGATVPADFSCTDASEIVACDGTVADGEPIATGTPGLHEFAVRAEDVWGNAARVTHRYSVRADGDGGPIAYIRDEDIRTVDAFGGGDEQLTDLGDASNEVDESPAYSPDGEQIAFASARGGTPQIWTMPADGGEPELLPGQGTTDQDARRPAWSTTGRIAFVTTRHGAGNAELYAVGADGSDLTRLTEEGGHDTDPAWSPDGKRIAFIHADVEGPTDLWVMNADGSSPVRLTDDFIEDADPEWSPDGESIAWSRDDDGERFIAVLPADGTGEPEEVIGGGQDPAWSPDGDRMAFVAPTPGSGEEECIRCERGIPQPNRGPDAVWVATLDGEDRYPIAVTENGDEPHSPDWAPAVETGPPSITIDDKAVDEGAAATFTLRLSEPADGEVTVHAATADRTATAGVDYTPVEQDVTFDEDGLAHLTVPTLGDEDAEPDETFLVELSGAEGATIADARAVGTILDDDEAAGPRITIGDAEVTETDATDRVATVRVALSDPATDPVTVDFATADGSAATPGDYAARAGTITFGEGDDVADVEVTVHGDRLDETSETLHLDLSNAAGASLATDRRGTVTIRDDDVAPPLDIRDVAVLEGHAGTTDAVFTVALARPSGRPVTTGVVTRDGTAQAPGDFTAVATQLTFAPGETAKTVAVPVRGDTVREYDFERFLVDLVSPSNPVDANRAVGTIVDDDPGPPVDPPGEETARRSAGAAAGSAASTVPPALSLPVVVALGGGPALDLQAPRLTGGTVEVALVCAAASRPCRGTVGVRLGRTVLGRARFSARAGTRAVARVALSRRARRALRGKVRPRVTLVVAMHGRTVVRTQRLITPRKSTSKSRRGAP